MINDHSEVMSTIQSKISALNAALNDKELDEASIILYKHIDDMRNLLSWIVNESAKDTK